VLFVAVDGPAAGKLRIAFPIWGSTSEAIRLLHADGILIITVNGDDRSTAEAGARKLDLDGVDAEVLSGKKGNWAVPPRGGLAAPLWGWLRFHGGAVKSRLGISDNLLIVQLTFVRPLNPTPGG
jgi:hypothetical protein